VLLVVDSLDGGGGAERHVSDLAIALSDRGHAVKVACSSGGELAAGLSRAGVPVFTWGERVVKRRLSFGYAAWLHGLLAEAPVEIVHAHLFASATAAAAAAADVDVPFVLTDHTEGPWRGATARWLSRLAYRRADAVIAVSSAIERQLVDGYSVPPERVSMVLPVPPARQAPGWRRPRHGRHRPLVGRVARLQPEKGCDVFVRAAARVAEEVPNARFVLIGSGPLRGALATLTHRLGIGGRVELLGYRPDARALIGALDLLAVSSLSDGSPLVVVEAMAAGVPIVATAVGGIPDQLHHGREGLLVPPGDPAALAAAMTTVLRDPRGAARMGAAGRHRAADLRHDRMVGAIEGVYRAARARRSRPVRLSADLHHAPPALAARGG
jgi:glycosyltransferase involved in cell wall biosynthesis